jgi:hypothetical protein
MLLVAIAGASAAELTCTAGVTSVPIFDPSSVSGAVGDYTLDCTGGVPVVPPAPLVNFFAFLNVPVLNTGGWILTDGISNFPGTLGNTNQIDFLSVPFNPPGDGHVFWQVKNIFVDPSGELPGFPFFELVSEAGVVSIPIANPVQLVAVNGPEPGTLLLTGLALGAIGCWWRRTAIQSRA